MPKNEKGNLYLTCRGVRYGSLIDEDIFFEWLDKIPCIESVDGVSDYLYLDLVSSELDYEGMRDLVALFLRYKINIHQLLELMNENNQAAIQPWIKKILRTKKIVYKQGERFVRAY